MSRENDILFELIDIWAEKHELYSMQGTVKTVDLNERTCVVSPTDAGPDVYDVYLEADSGSSTNKGFFVVPAVNSIVIISFINKEEAFISAWTEIDKVITTQAEWVFNDGTNGGLTKLQELTNRLNEYETLFNQLKTDLTTWVPAPSDGGTALKTVLTSGFLTKTIPSSNKSDFENEDVKH